MRQGRRTSVSERSDSAAGRSRAPVDAESVKTGGIARITWYAACSKRVVRFGRLVAVVVTTTLRYVLEIVPPEPAPLELRPCEQAVEEKAGDGEDGVAARVPGLPPCPRETPRKCADA